MQVEWLVGVPSGGLHVDAPSTLAADEGGFYVSRGDVVAKFDPERGVWIWTYDHMEATPGWRGAPSPPRSKTGVAVYRDLAIAPVGDELLAFSTSSGELVWAAPIGEGDSPTRQRSGGGGAATGGR